MISTTTCSLRNLNLDNIATDLNNSDLYITSGFTGSTDFSIFGSASLGDVTKSTIGNIFAGHPDGPAYVECIIEVPDISLIGPSYADWLFGLLVICFLIAPITWGYFWSFFKPKNHDSY